jgi:hypothetical protein
MSKKEKQKELTKSIPVQKMVSSTGISIPYSKMMKGFYLLSLRIDDQIIGHFLIILSLNVTLFYPNTYL